MITDLAFPGADGTRLAYREIGSGHPLILIHGFMGSGEHWMSPGLAPALAEIGFRVVLPDMRGHGASTVAPEPGNYPADILAADGLALIEHLGLADGEYDLGGYSLGSRITLRMLARGARPRRAVAAAQGLENIVGLQAGGELAVTLRDLAAGLPARPGSVGAIFAARLAEHHQDPAVLVAVLDSLVPTAVDDLRAMTLPVLVTMGDEDERRDAPELAALIPGAGFVSVPGTHEGAMRTPEFAAAVSAFLSVV